MPMLGDIRDQRSRTEGAFIGMDVRVKLYRCSTAAALSDGRAFGLNVAELVRDRTAKIEFLDRRAVDVDMVFVVAIFAREAFPTRFIPQICAALGAGKMIGLGSRRGHLRLSTNSNSDRSL